MNRHRILIGLVLAAAAGSAQAATEVQLDVNGLQAVAAGGTFGTSFTGSLTLSADANSSLASIFKNGAPAGGFTGPYTGLAVLAFSATFSFVGGDISGIGISVGVDTNADTFIDNTYTTSIAAGMGNIDDDKGKPGDFIITARTFGGMFNAATFAGVDVSEFFGFSNPGNFINFKVTGALLNGSSHTDNDVDIDIFVRTPAIPLPTSAGMASIGLLGLAGVRRRRAC